MLKSNTKLRTMGSLEDLVYFVETLKLSTLFLANHILLILFFVSVTGLAGLTYYPYFEDCYLFYEYIFQFLPKFGVNK